jgi:hypothetical protein
MPEKKKLKKRIRARMAETGERYTKASNALRRSSSSAKPPFGTISPPLLKEVSELLRTNEHGFCEEFVVTTGVANARTWKMLDTCYLSAFRVSYEVRHTSESWPAGVITLHGSRQVDGREEDALVHRRLPTELDERSPAARLLAAARVSPAVYDFVPASALTLSDVIERLFGSTKRQLLRISRSMLPLIKHSTLRESGPAEDGFLGLGVDVIGEVHGNLVVVHERQPEDLVTLFSEFEPTSAIIQTSWGITARDRGAVPEELATLWDEPEETSESVLAQLMSREFPKSETSLRLGVFTLETLSDLLVDLEFSEEDPRKVLFLVAHPSVAERIPDLKPSEIPRSYTDSSDSSEARVVAHAWGTTILSNPRCDPSMLVLRDVAGHETLVEIISSIEAPTVQERRAKLLSRALTLPLEEEYEEVVLSSASLRDLLVMKPSVLITRAELMGRTFPGFGAAWKVTEAYADNNEVGPARRSSRARGHLDLGPDVFGGVGESLLFLDRPDWHDEEHMLVVPRDGEPRRVRWVR